MHAAYVTLNEAAMFGASAKIAVYGIPRTFSVVPGTWNQGWTACPEIHRNLHFFTRTYHRNFRTYAKTTTGGDRSQRFRVTLDMQVQI